jgi:hypothetical protein
VGDVLGEVAAVVHVPWAVTGRPPAPYLGVAWVRGQAGAIVVVDPDLTCGQKPEQEPALHDLGTQ